MLNLSVPFQVTWYLTKACNLQCTHCYNYAPEESGRPLPGELGFSDIINIAENLINAGVMNFLFAGGEPLLKKWFIDLLLYLESRGVKYGFSTNGTLFSHSLAKKLVNLKGLRMVQFSLDGDKLSHDAIRGPGSFDEVMAAANCCDQYRIPYVFSMTLINSNKTSLKSIIDLCIERHCYFSIQSFVPAGRSFEEAASIIPNSEYRSLLNYTLSRVKDGLMISKFPCHATTLHRSIPWDPDTDPVELSCGAGTSTGIVFENGDLGICDFIREDIVGNLRTSTIEELWTSNSPALARWRNIKNVEGCGTCGNKSVCGYGCRANAYYRRGSLEAWDPACVAHTNDIIHAISIG